MAFDPRTSRAVTPAASHRGTRESTELGGQCLSWGQAEQMGAPQGTAPKGQLHLDLQGRKTKGRW